MSSETFPVPPLPAAPSPFLVQGVASRKCIPESWRHSWRDQGRCSSFIPKRNVLQEDTSFLPQGPQVAPQPPPHSTEPFRGCRASVLPPCLSLFGGCGSFFATSALCSHAFILTAPSGCAAAAKAAISVSLLGCHDSYSTPFRSYGLIFRLKR